jgi:NAD(P)-dependent dehydrogenase (short-subunit alcohol dehydrogenase family)
MVEASSRNAMVTGAASGMPRAIVFALHQPPHVQIAEMMILPVNRY